MTSAVSGRGGYLKVVVLREVAGEILLIKGVIKNLVLIDL